MPVSPQDFALWSRMTGNPMPRTPAEQMALAPQVFQFNRQLGQGQNPLQSAAESISSTIDKVGKAALGLGVLTGAGLLGVKALRNLPDRTDAKSEEPAGKVADTPSFWETQAAKLAAQEKPAVAEEVQEAAAPSSKEFLSSAITRYSQPEETPDIEVVRVEEIPADQGTYPEGQQVRSLIPQGLLAPASEASPTQVPDSVRFARETARGLTRAELLGGQYAQAAAKRRGTMEFGGAEPPVAGMADPYALREVAARQTRVEIPATQTVIPQPGAMPGRLQLDDEVAVDNDVIASNPLSTTAAASQDITGADPASAIGQRINVNQTGAAAAARAATEVKPTIASKLAQQQSPVHLEQSGSELVGAPEAGAVEAFRKGRQYQEMTRQNPALRPIPSPTTEGVSSADIYPTVVQRAPVQTVSPSALGEEPPTATTSVVTPGVRRTADQDEQELLMRKYAGLAPKAQPAAAPQTQTVSTATVPDVTEKLLRQAKAIRQSEEEAGGVVSISPRSGAIKQMTLHPSNELSVEYVSTPGKVYRFDASDDYADELRRMHSAGEFTQKGQGSAGSYVAAGRGLAGQTAGWLTQI